MRRIKGFSLTELLIVLVVGAVLLAVGAPSFASFLQTQRVRMASYDVVAALSLARSEAIKRNMDVELRSASTGAQGWKDGWTIVAGAAVISTQAAFQRLVFAGPTDAITYGVSGRLSKGGAVNIQISGESESRCVSVGLDGMPRSKKGGC